MLTEGRRDDVYRHRAGAHRRRAEGPSSRSASGGDPGPKPTVEALQHELAIPPGAPPFLLASLDGVPVATRRRQDVEHRGRVLHHGSGCCPRNRLRRRRHGRPRGAVSSVRGAPGAARSSAVSGKMTPRAREVSSTHRGFIVVSLECPVFPRPDAHRPSSRPEPRRRESRSSAWSERPTSSTLAYETHAETRATCPVGFRGTHRGGPTTSGSPRPSTAR